MSEYKVINVEFMDGDCLVEALDQNGLCPEVHKEGTRITPYYQGREKPLAHIVVRKNKFSGMGDAGFEKTKSGYVLHVDEYDYRPNGVDKLKMNKIKQYYAEAVIKKSVKKHNRFVFKSRQEKEGKIKIKINVR